MNGRLLFKGIGALALVPVSSVVPVHAAEGAKAAWLTAASPAAGPSPAAYSSTGDYLDYYTRSNIGTGSNVKIDAKGFVTIKNGATYVYNPVTIAQYGLEQYTYYKHNGDPAALHRAVVQAGWLVSNQNPNDGKVDLRLRV